MPSLDDCPDLAREQAAVARVLRCCGDEDALQEAYLRLQRCGLSGLDDPVSYWRRAARNAAVDAHRFDQRQQKVLAGWDLELARLDQDFDDELVGDERIASLRCAIERLPVRRRALIEAELSGVHDTAELAARLHTTPGAVRVLRHRTYADLRRILETARGGGPP